MKDKSKLKHISIQSKVSPEAAACLDDIVKKYKFKSRYEVMQYLLTAFLSYVNPDYGVSEDIDISYVNELSKVFEDFENKKNRVISTKPRGRKSLRMVGSIYIFSEIGKRGYVARNIKINGDDIHTNSRNSASLETVVRLLFPSIASRLDGIGRTIGECRYEDIISDLIEQCGITGEDKLHNEITNELNHISPRIEYGVVPKKTRSKSVDDEQGL